MRGVLQVALIISNRTHFVDISGIKSGEEGLIYGVPQGLDIHRNKSDTEDSSMLKILKSIQKQMKQDSEQFKLSFTFLNQSMSKEESSLTAVVARLTVLEDENNNFREECEELKIKNATLVRRVNELDDSVIEQEQYSRVANLEIRDVPQTDKEDVFADM
ncbi:hypothetical protein J6590_102668 [Homalodisca vitripennis]|nr:hypothetical protein J6590_102668 [Homalodisca vitripennis]